MLQAGDPRVTSRTAVATAILLSLILALALAWPHAYPLNGLTTFGYDNLDARGFLWNFWWTRMAVSEGLNPLSTDLIFHPVGTSLALHSYPLPYAAASLPIQQILPGPHGLVVAFNGVVIASFVLSGLGAYWLAVRLTGNRLAALVAALAFAGMPFRAANIPRLHLLATEFLALYVLAWIAFVQRPSRSRAAAVGAVLALTFYTSPEYALAEAGFSALWLFVKSGARHGSPSGRLAPSLAVAVGVAALLCGPLLYAQVRDSWQGSIESARPLGEVAAWSPALLSYVTPSRFNPAFGHVFRSAGEYGTPGVEGMRSETSIAITVWALALIGVARARRDGSRVWVIAAGAFLILALGPWLRLTGTWTTNIPLPYLALYGLLPPLRASRDATRLFPMAMLMISVLAAFGLRACLERLHRPMLRILAAAVVVGLVVLESLTPWPAKIAAGNLIDPVYHRIAAADGAFAVMDLSMEQTALLAQTLHGKPITAGATWVPRSASVHERLQVEEDFRRPERVLDLEPAARARRLADNRQALRTYTIRFVVIPSDHTNGAALARELGLEELATGALTLYEQPTP